MAIKSASAQTSSSFRPTDRCGTRLAKGDFDKGISVMFGVPKKGLET